MRMPDHLTISVSDDAYDYWWEIIRDWMKRGLNGDAYIVGHGHIATGTYQMHPLRLIEEPGGRWDESVDCVLYGGEGEAPEDMWEFESLNIWRRADLLNTPGLFVTRVGLGSSFVGPQLLHFHVY